MYLVINVVFVFFKQKTAYEMRISDWSSDVCSSDLYRDYKDRGLEILAFPCNQFGAQEPGDAAEIANFCSLTYAVSFPVMAKIEEIGRASCRERVCQYV